VIDFTFIILGEPHLIRASDVAAAIMFADQTLAQGVPLNFRWTETSPLTYELKA
jgi:hypothetical protein